LLVFEKKYRGSNSHDNSIDGLGLGLYQCKKILEKHNASLEMQTDSRSETKLCILFRDVIKNARRNDDDSLY
jgi:K+-sensing histidine kinase KdpD